MLAEQKSLQYQVKTPDFQGVHLWNRLVWARENLTPYFSDYRIVYENDLDSPCRIVIPDPWFMACGMNGGILPDITVYKELAKDELKEDFNQHDRGYLLHTTKPCEAMTEEEVINFIMEKDVPQHVLDSHKNGNRNKIMICKTDKLPKTRLWRDAWVLSGNKIDYNNKLAVNIFKKKSKNPVEMQQLIESWEQTNGNV